MVQKGDSVFFSCRNSLALCLLGSPLELNSNSKSISIAVCSMGLNPLNKQLLNKQQYYKVNMSAIN